MENRPADVRNSRKGYWTIYTIGDGGDNQDHLRVHRLPEHLRRAGKLPRTVEGTQSWVIARSIAALASERFSGRRLNQNGQGRR